MQVQETSADLDFLIGKYGDVPVVKIKESKGA